MEIFGQTCCDIWFCRSEEIYEYSDIYCVSWQKLKTSDSSVFSLSYIFLTSVCFPFCTFTVFTADWCHFSHLWVLCSAVFQTVTGRVGYKTGCSDRISQSQLLTLCRGIQHWTKTAAVMESVWWWISGRGESWELLSAELLASNMAAGASVT